MPVMLHISRVRKIKTISTILLFWSVLMFFTGLMMTLHIQSRDHRLQQNKAAFSNVKFLIEFGSNESKLALVSKTESIETNFYNTKETDRNLVSEEQINVIDIIQNNLSTWKDVYCSGNLYNFDGSFILMKNVVIDPSKKQSNAIGGEDLQSVIGRDDKSEEVAVLKGFFTLPCKYFPEMETDFSEKNHFSNWISGISVNNLKKTQEDIIEEPSFTILVKRNDYANLYWTLIELYNAFLTVLLFRENPKTTHVIIMDAHPRGKLDNLWNMLFGKIQRIGQITIKSLHKKLVWVIPDGPLALGDKMVPFIKEFKLAMYKEINTSPSLYNEYSCSEIQNVTFIIRKNYIAHARNPSGVLKRKISNENMLISYLKKHIPEAKINAIQIDLLKIEDQIKLIYETNILVGVHGAGLGHTLLLRTGSTLIELFPSSYKYSWNRHFEQFAFWADVHYVRHYFNDPVHKGDEWVYIEPEATKKLIKDAVYRTCKQ